MILNSKSLIKKVKKVKFKKLNSTILQSPLFMSIRLVLRKLGQASPCQLVYGMQIQALLNSPSLLGDSGSAACNTYFLCEVLIGQVYDITERG